MTETIQPTNSNIVVTFNVGGSLFQTTYDTLAKEPDNLILMTWRKVQEKTMLSTTSVVDGVQAIFFDRDPEAFKPLMKYLRGSNIKMSDFTAPEVQEEIGFFCFTNLSLIIKESTKVVSLKTRMKRKHDCFVISNFELQLQKADRIKVIIPWDSPLYQSGRSIQTLSNLIPSIKILMVDAETFEAIKNISANPNISGAKLIIQTANSPTFKCKGCDVSSNSNSTSLEAAWMKISQMVEEELAIQPTFPELSISSK